RESDKLVPVRQGHATGMPIEWVRVHDLPDYVYFNHSAHVSRGIGCKSCHGRVDKMAVVFQVERLSMGWCLDCHRDPEQHLRPRQWVTRMDWHPAPDEQLEQGKQLRDEYNINPSTDCSTCHR
ncbi:MAG: cytochrome c3 family protein, partial [Phycisphaerales bacterium]